MSLQGMLETIPLPDVLALLSATRKSGELRVNGNRCDGRLWLRDGSVVGADVPRATTPVDAVFELLRLTSGSFAFESGAAATNPVEPVAVDALVSEAQERLGEWKAIEAVVSSVRCTVALAAELTGESVTIKREQWKQLVAVASAGDVTEAMKRLGVGEFDACRTVKELAGAGLVKVGEAPKAAPGPEPTPVVADGPEAPTLPHRSPSRPSADGDAAPAAPAAAANGGTAARRPAPAPTPAAKAAEPPAERAPLGPARPSVPTPAPAERAPLGSARPSASAPAERAQLGPARPSAMPSRSAPAPAERAPLGSARPSAMPSRAPAPAGRRAPVPSAEEADDLVHQLASLGRGDASPPAPAPVARTESRTAPAAARPAPSARGKVEPAPAPTGPPAAEEAAADADAPKPADAAQDEPINRGMLLKFLSSVRP